VWNLLGILDPVVAVGSGIVTSGYFPDYGPVTTAPMARFAATVGSSVLRAIFVMLHLSALFQTRVRHELSREAGR
jgi:hypothetical protein